MSRYQREKGKRGERQWRDVLREAGFEAKRGQQFAGGIDSPDVVCRELSKVHFEVKVGKAPPIYGALLQATRDGGPAKIPIVASRKDGERRFLVTMADETFFAILRDGMEALGGQRLGLVRNTDGDVAAVISYAQPQPDNTQTKDNANHS